MALNTDALNAMSDGLAGVAGFMSIHDGAAGATGLNEISGGGYARQAVTWDPATGGIATNNGTVAFSGPASQAVAEVGLWSAVTGGTFYGSDVPTGDLAFNAAGEYNVPTATITTTDNT